MSSGILVLLLAALLSAQGTPPSPLTLVSREGRRPVQTTFIGGQELVRDFHPAAGTARTAIRWLDRAEVDKLLAPPKAKRRATSKRRKAK